MGTGGVSAGVGKGGSGGMGAPAGTGGGSSVGGSSAVAGSAGASGSTGGQLGGRGGTSGNGGSTGAGGTTATGGSTGAGGTTATGGSTGAGGTTATGGSTGAGGTTATGGSTGSAGRGGAGGSTGSGGSTGAAGSTGSGGTTATGGTTGAGGSTASAQPVGFASLNGGTVGGLGAQAVTASTYAQLKSYAESATTYIIMVQGTISNGANGGKISVKSNKSIIGVGSTAFLFGVGLDINNANNIIVQNLRVSMTGVTTRTDTAGVYSSTGDEGLPQILVNGGDAISISGTSKNIWIDHCELFSEDPDVQTNNDLYDGLIDVKGQTGFITISWCYLHDHHKGGLVGASDTDLFADRKITLHHNYYNNVKLRIPMYRGAVGHFFNNYIVGATDASRDQGRHLPAGGEELLRSPALLDLHDLGFPRKHRADRQRRGEPHVPGLSGQLHRGHPVFVLRRADRPDQRRQDRRPPARGRREDLTSEPVRDQRGIVRVAARAGVSGAGRSIPFACRSNARIAQYCSPLRLPAFFGGMFATTNPATSATVTKRPLRALRSAGASSGRAPSLRPTTRGALPPSPAAP